MALVIGLPARDDPADVLKLAPVVGEASARRGAIFAPVARAENSLPEFDVSGRHAGLFSNVRVEHLVSDALQDSDGLFVNLAVIAATGKAQRIPRVPIIAVSVFCVRRQKRDRFHIQVPCLSRMRYEAYGYRGSGEALGCVWIGAQRVGSTGAG